MEKYNFIIEEIEKNGHVIVATEDAKAFLHDVIEDIIAQAIKGDTEGTAEALEDVIAMIKTLNAEDWEACYIEECPMSISGLNILEAAVKR